MAGDGSSLAPGLCIACGPGRTVCASGQPVAYETKGGWAQPPTCDTKASDIGYDNMPGR